MKQYFNKIKASVVFVMSLLIASTLAMPVYAASGNQGYAIYRDGVQNLGNLVWHAGFMDDPTSTATSWPVLHMAVQTDGETRIGWDSWSHFLYGKNFKGVFKPKGGITSSQRDDVVTLSRSLLTEDIGYTFVQQVQYSAGDQYWVWPKDITNMRCDGLVEYCYEWFGHRIIGADEVWDITRNNHQNWSAHSYTPAVQPKTQSEAMTLVQSSTP